MNAATRLTLLAIAMAALVCVAAPKPAGKSFPALTVGMTTYTNVVVTYLDEGTITFRHAGGLASFKVEKLQPEVQQQLGVTAVTPRKSSPGPAKKGPVDLKTAINDLSGEEFTQVERLCLLAMPTIGFALLLIGHVWIVVSAFRVSAGWGLACTVGTFLCGLINLAFVLGHWHEAKRGFICKMLGLLLVFFAAIAVPNFVQAKRVAAARNAAPSNPR